MKVALIGYGRLGKLLAKNLSQDFDLGVLEASSDIEIPSTFIKIEKEQLKNYPIIILAIPINKVKDFCLESAPYIAQNTLVIDTCSVKKYPMEVMKKHLGKDVKILGTHPMFGPDSARKTLWGSKIVLCPERVDETRLSDITSYLESHGLKVIIETADNHDREISQSLALTHLIGRALIDYGAKELAIDTKGHRRLMKILETVENDTIELFKDMNAYNPHAQKMRKKFIQILQNIDEKIDISDQHIKKEVESKK